MASTLHSQYPETPGHQRSSPDSIKSFGRPIDLSQIVFLFYLSVSSFNFVPIMRYIPFYYSMFIFKLVL